MTNDYSWLRIQRVSLMSRCEWASASSWFSFSSEAIITVNVMPNLSSGNLYDWRLLIDRLVTLFYQHIFIGENESFFLIENLKKVFFFFFCNSIFNENCYWFAWSLISIWMNKIFTCRLFLILIVSVRIRKPPLYCVISFSVLFS